MARQIGQGAVRRARAAAPASRDDRQGRLGRVVVVVRVFLIILQMFSQERSAVSPQAAYRRGSR